MKYSNQFVPQPNSPKGAPYPLLVKGDQLSVEQMVTARTVMSDHSLLKRTLKGLVPSPQKFHHRLVAIGVNSIICFEMPHEQKNI